MTCNEKIQVTGAVDYNLNVKQDMIKSNCREEQNKLFFMSTVGRTSNNKL